MLAISGADGYVRVFSINEIWFVYFVIIFYWSS
jgi:hypothetical protein